MDQRGAAGVAPAPPMGRRRRAEAPRLRPVALARGLVERLLLAVYMVSYGAIGIDLLHSAVRTGVEENPFAGHFNRMRYAAIIVALLLVAISDTATRRVAVRGALPFLPFIAVAALTIATTDDAFTAARYLVLLAGMVMGFSIIIARIGLPAAMGAALHVLAATLVASTALAALAPAIGRHSALDMLELGHVGRWRGVFGHKNTLGAFAALGAPLLLFYGRLMPAPRAYLWLARLSAVACLVLAGSVNSLLGGMAAVVACLLIRRRAMQNPLVLATLAVVIAFALAVAMDDISAEFLGRDATFSGRTIVWSTVLDLWKSNPLLGYGYGAGSGIVRPYLTSMLFLSAVDAHNAYFDLLLEAGLLGLGAFLFALCVTAWRGRAVVLALHGQPGGEAAEAAAVAVIAACLMSIGEVSPFRLVGGAGPIFYLCCIGLLAARAPTAAQPASARGAHGHGRGR